MANPFLNKSFNVTGIDLIYSFTDSSLTISSFLNQHPYKLIEEDDGSLFLESKAFATGYPHQFIVTVKPDSIILTERYKDNPVPHVLTETVFQY